jgi:predicted Rossmann-fold nucleotide-binding protein
MTGSVAGLHIFFVNTTKQEKIDQLNAVAERRHYPVLFLRVTDLGEPAHSPEELTGSFKNNKNKKLFSCANHLSQFAYPQVKEAMHSLGFSVGDIENGKIKLYGVAEDSGLSFDRGGPRRTAETQKFVDMFFNTGPDGPYQTDADKEMVKSLESFSAWEKIASEGDTKKRKPFPGVETVRVLGAAGGVSNFFRLTNLTMKKLGLAVDSKHTRRDSALILQDDSILGAFAWEPKHEQNFMLHLKHHPEIVKEGKGKSSSVYDGTGFEKPEMTRKELTTYGVSIPLHRMAQKKYTSREDLGPIFQPAARGDAMGDLMTQLKIAPLGATAWASHLEKRGFSLGAGLKGREYAVSLLPGDSNYPHPTLRHHARKAIGDAGMTVRFPGETEEHSDPKHLPRLWSDMHLFQQMIDNNDAIVFMPSGAKERLDKTRELEQFLAGSYYCIDKTLSPTGKGKAAIFLEQKTGDFDRFIRQLNTLFNHGAFGDRPSKLIKKATSPEQVVELLEEHREHYRPVIARKEPSAPVPDVKDKTGKYNVCVFLSASMEGVYQEKAEALGKRIQASGMTLAYGAADRNMMGGLYKGALSAARNRKEPPSLMGSTTHVIAATECEHGKKPEQIPDEFFYLAPNITKRKEFLFKNSHAFVLMEGGVGSLDELLTYMYYKENEPEAVKDKPMVISESAYTKDSMFKQVLDLYLGQDASKLKNGDRKSIYKRTGLMIMEPPVHLPESGRKKLFQIEMDAVIEFLKDDRAKHHPQLVPGSQHFQRMVTSSQTQGVTRR